MQRANAGSTTLHTPRSEVTSSDVIEKTLSDEIVSAVFRSFGSRICLATVAIEFDLCIPSSCCCVCACSSSPLRSRSVIFLRRSFWISRFCKGERSRQERPPLRSCVTTGPNQTHHLATSLSAPHRHPAPLLLQRSRRSSSAAAMSRLFGLCVCALAVLFALLLVAPADAFSKPAVVKIGAALPLTGQRSRRKRSTRKHAAGEKKEGTQQAEGSRAPSAFRTHGRGSSAAKQTEQPRRQQSHALLASFC